MILELLYHPNMDNVDIMTRELKYALNHNDVEASSQIEKVLAWIEGEHDGPNYHWLVQLKNKKIAYLVGGCDYTGWDCQSSFGTVREFNNLEEALHPTGLPSFDDHNVAVRETFQELLKGAI